MGPDIPSGTAIDDFEGTSCHGLDPSNNPARIVDTRGNTIGVAWFDDYFYEAADEKRPYLIDEVMRDLEPNCLLSSGTTILDAVELFTAKESICFYVIDKNGVVGVLSYEDLFKPVGRIAFLSLALEIEDLALRLCQAPKFRERCWLSIPVNRKQIALSFFRQRYRRKPKMGEAMLTGILNSEIRELIEVRPVNTKTQFDSDRGGQGDVLRLMACTQLKDKATMIWKNRLTTGSSKTDILRFFEELTNVRDRCAHPGHDDPILAQHRLAHFVGSAMRMRKSLQEAIENSAEEEHEQLETSALRQ